MNDERPNPDELLARVKHEEARECCGRLKVFFGPAAGVGKTYAMLEAARQQRAAGVDVVVGYAECHGRRETEALLEGLEVLPLQEVEYRGITVREFDLDRALARHPQLMVVDELAHTNAPGMRHPKRWQDVLELLDAGIDVYTAVNVQHVESLNDVVSQITGITVRETVPDSVLENADEIEMIDLAPDDLIQRLKEGKVYVPQQSAEAIHNFFRPGNLMALRELALRRTADRVDEKLRGYRRDHAIAQTWPARERLLVMVSANPLSARLVRAARRMATGLGAEWIAVYVETAESARLSEEERNRVSQALNLAERLGGEVVTLSGPDVSEEILAYARSRNVTKIIIGKPVHPRWKELLLGSVVDDLVRHSGPIDVYVISGDPDYARPVSTPARPRQTRTSAYLWAVGAVAVCTVASELTYGRLDLSNLVMIYLLGVVVAAHLGRGPSILASVLSVVAFDFFFSPPLLSFQVEDTQFLITLAVMLVVAIVISRLTVQVQLQAHAARERERRTAALYAMSREFASKRGVKNLVSTAEQRIGELFDSQAVVLLPDPGEGLVSPLGGGRPFDAKELSVAQWAFEHKQLAGLGSHTLPAARGLYLPLITSQGTLGVLRVEPKHPDVPSPEQVRLLETFANQTALAIERARLAEEAGRAQVRMETERLRNLLLNSVSQSLKTPLAAISSAAQSLLESNENLDSASRYEEIQVIVDESERLSGLVRNLLDMSRLESGAMQVHKELESLDTVISGALQRTEEQLREHPTLVRLPDDLPPVPLDRVLIEQVLFNLLENAGCYTPDGTSIDLSAWQDGDLVTVEVADHGPGLPPGEERRVFEKFYRLQHGDQAGAGLGLAICQGIVEAHGGRIWAENRPGGGAAFRFTLPLR